VQIERNKLKECVIANPSYDDECWKRSIDYVVSAKYLNLYRKTHSKHFTPELKTSLKASLERTQVQQAKNYHLMIPKQ
jgi:hypothetical protein